ncbi:MAG: hypothetical protein HYW06_10845, partial [Gemmatimonadetes bacterium]|nr:hypothetical protein [Gemmatimonadota bacterium]
MITTWNRAAVAWFVPTGLAALTTGVLACAAGNQPIALGLAGPFSEPRAVSMRPAAPLAVAEINR